jgi:hypothetical protein
MTTFPGGSPVRTWTPPLENGNGPAYGKSSLAGAYGARRPGSPPISGKPGNDGDANAKRKGGPKAAFFYR